MRRILFFIRLLYAKLWIVPKYSVIDKIPQNNSRKNWIIQSDIFNRNTLFLFSKNAHAFTFNSHVCLSKSIISSTTEPTSPHTHTSKRQSLDLFVNHECIFRLRARRVNNEQILARRPFQCVSHYLTFFFEPPITVTVHCLRLTSRRFPAFDK